MRGDLIAEDFRSRVCKELEELARWHAGCNVGCVQMNGQSEVGEA
jgi:hypothetical protein